MSFPLCRPAALTGALFLALALLLPQAPARAATVAYSLVLPVAAAPNPLATSTAGASVTLEENAIGSFVNDRLSPWDSAISSNSLLDKDDPSSVYSALRNGTATYAFGGIYQELSLVWGTPGGTLLHPNRPRNILTLLLNGVSQLTLLGGDGPGAFSGTNTLSVLVTINDVKFDTMVLSAGNPAFEFANLSFQRPAPPIPVPTAGLLLLTAVGCVAVLRRRKAV